MVGGCSILGTREGAIFYGKSSGGRQILPWGCQYSHIPGRRGWGWVRSEISRWRCRPFQGSAVTISGCAEGRLEGKFSVFPLDPLKRYDGSISEERMSSALNFPQQSSYGTSDDLTDIFKQIETHPAP